MKNQGKNQHEEQCSECTVRAGWGIVAVGCNFAMLHFFAFSALLSFWTLICNADFDSNSSCLDILSNFGIDNLQKLQNLPQNAISIIIGTLMCKLG